MDNAERALSAFEGDSNYEQTIRNAVTTAYQDLKPEAEAVAHYENQQLPTFYDSFSGYGMGTGAADMSPTARMAAASGQVANQAATAQVARGIFDTRRAGMEDLIKTGASQWQTQYGMASDQYDRAFQQQQFAEQQRQFNEQMAASAAARASAGRSGSGYGSSGIVVPGIDTNAAYQKYLNDLSATNTANGYGPLVSKGNVGYADTNIPSAAAPFTQPSAISPTGSASLDQRLKFFKGITG